MATLFNNPEELPRPLDPQNRGARRQTKHATERLGKREREVLEVLWACGSASVQQVVSRLGSALAYTTVMTTLDRLFKKGLLLREKHDRAFVYRPALSPRDLEHDRAAAFIGRFFSSSAASDDMLLSCLVNAVEQYDCDLLQQLEEKIRAAREQAILQRNEPQTDEEC